MGGGESGGGSCEEFIAFLLRDITVACIFAVDD
jgi:hypothetical protein